jgi:hypothetical protein
MTETPEWMDEAVEAALADLSPWIEPEFEEITGIDAKQAAQIVLTAAHKLIAGREARVRADERERIAAELRRLPTAIKPHDPFAQGWWDAGIAEALCWITPIGEIHTAQRITRMCVEPENEHQLNVRYHSGGPVAGAQPYLYDPASSTSSSPAGTGRDKP